MLIPTVSCDESALFTYTNIQGWWRLAAEDIAAESTVIDLLIVTAKSAVKSGQWRRLLGIDDDGPNHAGRPGPVACCLCTIIRTSCGQEECTNFTLTWGAPHPQTQTQEFQRVPGTVQ